MTDDEGIESDDSEAVSEGNEPDGGEENKENEPDSGEEEPGGGNNKEESDGEEAGGDKESDNGDYSPEEESDGSNEGKGNESDNEGAGNEESGSEVTDQNETGNADQAELDEAELKQETYTVTMPEYHAENVETAEVKTLIGGVTWDSTPAYDGDTAGTYTFTAALPEGYTVAEDVALPQIAVTIREAEDTAWNCGWHFGEEYVFPEGELFCEDGDYSLVLAGGDSGVQIPFEEITSYLPAEVFLEYSSPETGSIQEEAVPIIGWNCPEYAEDEEGNLPFSGSFFLQAHLSKNGGEGAYGDIEGAGQIGVTLVFDAPMTMAADHTCNGITFSAWENDTRLPNTAGNYYLTKDVKVTGVWKIEADIKLCLNGHRISCSGTSISCVNIGNGGSLSVYDCQNSGELKLINKYTGNKSAATGVFVNSDGTFSLYSGLITAETDVQSDFFFDALYSNGKIYLYGGSMIATASKASAIAVNSHAEGHIYGGIYTANGKEDGTDYGLLTSERTYLAGNPSFSPASVWRMQKGLIVAKEDSETYTGSKLTVFVDSIGLVVGGLDAGTKPKFEVTPLSENYKVIQYPVIDGVEYIIVEGANTVSYDANSGTGEMAPQTFYMYGDDAQLTTAALRENVFTKSGHAFGGWNTKPDGTGTAYADQADFTEQLSIAERSTTLYAQWTAESYTVTYHTNNGTIANESNYTSYTYGTGLELPTPTRTGYRFDGWYDNSGLTGDRVIRISETETGAKEYYAKWAAESYTVTYHTNNGTIANESNYTSYTYGTGLELPTPTRTGYRFDGWYGNSGFTGDKVTRISETETEAKEYYAKWTANTYTIAYIGLDGATLSTRPATHTYGTRTEIGDPEKTGYTFAGWKVNGGTAVIKGLILGETKYTADIILTATWTPNVYTAAFDYQSATGGNTIQNKTVTYGGTYGDLPAPARTGYTFKGWFTAADGKGTPVTAETTVTATNNHTLYAYWTDETAPDAPALQAGVTLPADWTNTQTTIPLKLYDEVGVTGLLVSVDGSPYVEISGFSGGTGSVNYSYTVQSGEHKYQFKAVDAADNTSAESAIFTVKLDQTKPEIGTTTYENKAANLWQWIIGKTSLIIHVPVTDTGSGVKGISFCLTPTDAAGNPDSGNAVTDTATVSGGEAKITFDADFRGTIAINCTDAAGNAADSVTIGADAGGVIVEDKAPDITIQADRNPSDTQQTQPDGVAVADGYYDTAPALLVKVKDDTDNGMTGGLASVTYQVGDDAEKPVTVDQSTLQKAAQAAFTIPASEIPTGITKIKVTAADNAGNEATESITVKVKGPEKTPGAEIDYREEELKNLVPGEKYTIDGTEYTADGEGRIPLIEDWFGTTVSIVKKGNGNETTDSPAQSLPVPARPAAPHAPELGARDETSITLQTIAGARYRRVDGTGDWQDSTGFEGLEPGTIYSFQAYYLATATSFASAESSPAQIATVPVAPTKEKLKIGYVAETLTLTDGIEAFTDPSGTTHVTAGSAEAYMGQTIYIRYPADGIIPESLITPVPIPARPAKPTPGTVDASYPKAADGAITGLTSDKTYEYRGKNKDDSFSEWKSALPNGTKIENLPAGDYEVRVKAVETGNASFQSEAAAVTIGEKPATKYDTPDIRIDYIAETLTGFIPGAEYTIKGKTVIASVDGVINIEADWFGTTLSIIRKGNGKDKLDSDTQSLPVPARPAKPTPTGVDVSTVGGAGKLIGLAAGVAYEVSADGGSTWVSRTADGSGQITELAPGSYVVRVKVGTASFVSENSDRAEIGTYQVKVTFMANGENYREVFVDYGGTLADIPAVPPKRDAGDQTYTREWCSDQQGTPAVFTNLMADMTVYAVYTSTYTVALQGGTGYTLSAQAGSTSPVKEGGSFTFGFALSNGYQKTFGFAVKVNGMKAELTADGTYTISDIRENKTVAVEGVAKKHGKPSDPDGDKDKEDDSKSEDSESHNPAPKPPVTPPGKGKGPTPGITSPAETDRPAPEQKKLETGSNSGQEPEAQLTRGQTQEPKKQGESENQNTAANSENQNRQGTTVADNGGQSDSGMVKGVTATADQGRIVISGEKIPTGNVAGMEQASTAMALGNGAVFVTVVCEDEKYAAGVKDTAAVANAVLSAEQVQLVNDGKTIEIRVDVKDISEKVPQKDKEVIENGLTRYQEEVPALTLGKYVDISMFMKIGESDWDVITSTEEPIEVVIEIPEDMREDGREFYIIRVHEGEHTFMRDLDEEPDTITISTDMFSSYAIAYAAAGSGNGSNVCGLCHICPTFLGVCCFIWLAAAIVILLVIAVYILRRKREE